MKRWGEAPDPVADLLSAQSVLEGMQVAVVAADRFGKLTYWNSAAKELFGFDDDRDYRGTALLDLGIAEADREQAMELSRKVLRGGSWEGTFANIRRDRTVVYIRMQAVPFRHRSGAVEGMVVFAREALRDGRADDQYGLLDRIGRELADSLELSHTLQAVAELLVPQFADHCFIDLLDNDRLVRHTSMHSEGWTPPPGSWPQVGEPVTEDPYRVRSRAIRRLEAVLVDDIRHASPANPTPESSWVAEQVGLTSIIAAPLRARGQLLGVLTLCLSGLRGRERTHYDGIDRDLVGAIASRVALAIDNARLFEEERDTALAFQKSLLPREIPELDGLQVACRYEPAKPLETRGHGIQTQVGGDWYDVIPLSAGRVGIVIGDVEGRGAHAAAVMGQLRAAVRAFAQDDKSPADILDKLDEWVRALARADDDGEPRTPMVSCLYMAYDAWSRELSFANAGHAPPLIIVDGRVEELEMPSSGVMLGGRVKGMARDTVRSYDTIPLPPGATLVLYTDGLVDRRPQGGTIDTGAGLRILTDTVAAHTGSGVERIADAAARAVPGEIDDDMAMLVVRTDPDDLAVTERTFPAEAIVVSDARRLAGETFEAWRVDREQAELACLLVSEVVTNVVLHAAVPTRRRELVLDGPPVGVGTGFDESWADLVGPAAEADTPPAGTQRTREFTLRLRRGASAVWVEVFDQDLRLPRLRKAKDEDEGGRGLYLVDQLASRWGSRPTRDGKAVWFEIPTTSAAERGETVEPDTVHEPAEAWRA
ncbi:SpoIIE family protein phosphatase [Allonocardiopsis opalescens]|uniref:PAS domain S-box-containing protein n=1 Tax=Allonocardiopsis opalescens TaxID=1144618 RepID=A0A2T0Q9R8_9ACTN|nr:SpoIIE family protein phosphatase [Allonocardiopsis opalescens]PRY00639.1 PAS domain S-box-containing protein [Allonocardiopsis opalescens]